MPRGVKILVMARNVLRCLLEGNNNSWDIARYRRDCGLVKTSKVYSQKKLAEDSAK